MTGRLPPFAESRTYTCLTGATGLVGRYLLRDLLNADQPVAVILRPSKKQSATERMEAIMQQWENELGRPMARPVVFSGDIRLANAGLCESDQIWLKRHARRFIHSAAILQFSGDRSSEPWITNFQGTQNVCQLARQAAIDEFHYLSTAYVCGQRTGSVYEHELNAGQSFRNEYEKSKLEAEQHVRNVWGNQATVYRPAVVVGDSVTGATCSYHGLFLYLRLIAYLVPLQERGPDGSRITNIQLPFTGDEPRNLVPVDWVSQVICRLLNDPTAQGKTFHLSPSQGTTAKTVIDSCYEYFNSKGVQYANENSADAGNASEFARQFFENTRIYQMYETSDPEFDRSNLLHHVPDLECPNVDSAMIHKFLEFGQRDQWGKARRVAPRKISQQTILNQLQSWHIASGRPDNRFDVWGPGGGQWTLRNSPHNGVVTEFGIDPTVSTPIVRLTTRQLENETSGSELQSLMAQSTTPFDTTCGQFDRLR